VLTADSRIVQAIVFSDSAHVTRTTVVALADAEAQLARVALLGLPEGLDPAALRVSTNRGEIRALETAVDDAEPDPSSAAVRLDDEARALEDRLAELEALTGGHQAEIALIERLAPVPPSAGDKDGHPALRPDAFLSGLDFLVARESATRAALRQAERDLAELGRRLAEVREHQVRLGRTAGSARRSASFVVTLAGAGNGPCSLAVTYEAGWASWRPYYHLRLDPSAGTLECIRYADVWQQTSEDWTEIALRLSTAEPERGLRLPAIRPWSLGLTKHFEDRAADLYRAPAPPLPTAPKPPANDASKSALDAFAASDMLLATNGAPRDDPSRAFAAYAEQFEAEGPYAHRTAAGVMVGERQALFAGGGGGHGPPAETSLVRPSVTRELDLPARLYGARPRPSSGHPDLAMLAEREEPRSASGGIDFELAVTGKTTCAAGLSRRRVSLGASVHPARLEYLLRPAVRDHAVARASIENAGREPMLGGPAAIFVGDAFFGDSRIATTPGGGKLVLDLGAETRIRSARRSKTSARTTGLLSKEDVHLIEVTLEIESYLDQPVELEVEDQIPLSGSKEVKVRLVSSDPKDAKLDELTGVLRSKTRVLPRSRVVLSFSYQIEAPRDFQLRQSIGGLEGSGLGGRP
jgi:hypothetical protein